MKTTRLLLQIQYLSPTTNKYFYQINSIQQRCSIHTSVPLMIPHSGEEQPHARAIAKTVNHHKRTYQGQENIPYYYFYLQ